MHAFCIDSHDIIYLPVYKRAVEQMWLQPGKHPVIVSPLQSLSKRRSRVSVMGLHTLKDLVMNIHAQFGNFVQSDAQEFLRLFIGDLHEEMRPSCRGTPEAGSTSGLR